MILAPQKHTRRVMSYTRDTPIAADGGLGFNCLDFSFLVIDKS